MTQKLNLIGNRITFVVAIIFVSAQLNTGCQQKVADGTNNNLLCSITVTDSLGKIIGVDDASDWQPRMPSELNFPPSFSVKPAFPNPAGTMASTFGGDTPRIACAINYALPQARQQVKVTVNDTLRTLVDQQAQAGFFMVLWDLKDDMGAPVADGCYEVHITVSTDDTTYRAAGDILVARGN